MSTDRGMDKEVVAHIYIYIYIYIHNGILLSHRKECHLQRHDGPRDYHTK